jgi:hypothetical protein
VNGPSFSPSWKPWRSTAISTARFDTK